MDFNQLGKDVKDYEENKVPSTINLNIYLIPPNKVPSNGVISELLLDSYLNYYLRYRESIIDGKNAPSMFNSNGYTSIIASYKDMRSLSFILSREALKDDMVNLRPPNRLNEGSMCRDTSVGFKLSEILNNIGDVDKIPLDKNEVTESLNDKISSSPDSIIDFTQKAYLGERGNKRVILFKFNIENKDPNIVCRRVLFKDILSEGLSPIENEIYLNDEPLKDFKYKIDGRKIFIRLPLINPKESVTLTFPCYLNGELNSNDAMNFGALNLIISNSLKDTNNRELHSLIKISNVISLRNIF